MSCNCQVKEKSTLERELVAMDEVRKENAIWKVVRVILNGLVPLSVFDFDGL